MAVLKEFVCLAHGDFEAYTDMDGPVPSCPQGCHPSMTQRAFRTAPSIQSHGYRGLNSTFETLAREHGLSDMSNRSAIQDGTGQRRANADTYRRLNEATEMVIGPARAAGMSGRNAGDFFKPLREFGNVGGSAQSSLHRSADGTVSNDMGTTFSNPTPKLQAPAFDGSKLGLPAGDA